MHFISIGKIVCSTILLLFALSSFAQNGVLIQGKITDLVTQEPLTGAAIGVPSLQIGNITNENGEYRLFLAMGSYEVRASLIGYKDTTFVLTASQNIQLNVKLSKIESTLAEVVVTANKDDAMNKVNRNVMSLERLTSKEAKLLPAIFGEIDIIKVLQLKPGVKAGGEGNAGFFVRGGSADQNLILVDKAPVYNPNHLFGFFSVFNSDAVREVDLFKAGFPARYGGRLSSVLDVQMNQGDYKDWGIEGGIGLISSRLTIKTPIVKDRATLTLSGRRTYVDVFTRMVNRLNKNNPNFDQIPDYFFYDGNMRLDFLVNKKNEISLTGYYGDDFFKFAGDSFGARFGWGNRSLTLTWRHIFNEKLIVSNSYYLSGYNYRISNQFGENVFSLGSSIFDQGFTQDWEYNPTAQHQIQFGFTGIYHRFSVGNFSFATDFTSLSVGQLIEGGESAAYLSDNIKFSSRFEMSIGARLSNFLAKGKTHWGIEPRWAMNWKVGKGSALKASYARMYQYLHLVSLSNASLPTDIWYPSTQNVKPQSSDQVALGWHQALFKENYFFSLEGYYKWLHDAVDFRDGAQIFANPTLDNEFVRGKGWAYGVEAYIEKKKGKTTGWIGYTLAWSLRQFASINNGLPFYPRYDRRHDISVVIMHKLSPRVTLSGTWIYGTGNFVALATGRYSFQDYAPNTQITTIPIFTGRNDFQMPPTHRLDLGLVWKMKSKKANRASDITFSIYNAYSRRNPFFLYYEEKRDENDNPTEFVPTLVALFPILPAITYNFKF
jgi:hypothetical protein